jgi:hypothetical protein
VLETMTNYSSSSDGKLPSNGVRKIKYGLWIITNIWLLDYEFICGIVRIYGNGME